MTILNNVTVLIEESELFFDDIMMNEYVMPDSTKRTVLTYSGLSALHSAGLIGGYAAGVPDAVMLPAHAAATIGRIGYLVNRYRNSLFRIEKKVNRFKILLNSAREKKNTSAINMYSDKLKYWNNRLNETKQRLQGENKRFIEKTYLLKAKAAAMKKNGSDTSRLDNKIQQREEFIKKIGA